MGIQSNEYIYCDTWFKIVVLLFSVHANALKYMGFMWKKIKLNVLIFKTRLTLSLWNEVFYIHLFTHLLSLLIIYFVII